MSVLMSADVTPSTGPFMAGVTDNVIPVGSDSRG